MSNNKFPQIYSQEWFEFASCVLSYYVATRQCGVLPSNGGNADIADNIEAKYCWISRLKEKNTGYVVVNFLNKNFLLHRLSLIVASGNNCLGLDAAHLCGNRKCFNPQHLSWKTRQENHRDKLMDGTHSRGKKYIAKITEKRERTASEYVGVRLQRNSRKNPWIAKISQDGVCKYLGCFPTEEAAAAAYNAEAASRNANISNPREHFRLNTIIAASGSG